jgi:ornithine carrier protein
MSSPLVGAMVENAALFVGYRQVQRLIRSSSTTSQELERQKDLPENELPSLTIPQLILAGGASGAIASFVLTPVELIKCKLQVQIGNHAVTQGVQFNGPFHVIRHVLQSHGPSGFYRGFVATFLREAGGGAFWFGTYEYTCAQFIKYRQSQTGEMVLKKDLSPSELMVGGALGGMAYNFTLFPVDVIKSQMQTDEQLSSGSRQRSFAQTARELYAQGGYKAFYRGCGITVARSAPTSAIIFLTYVSCLNFMQVYDVILIFSLKIRNYYLVILTKIEKKTIPSFIIIILLLFYLLTNKYLILSSFIVSFIVYTEISWFM